MFDLNNYNEDQRKLVETIDRPVRALASAGSGKTYALIGRNLYMLNNGVSPDRIMNCTLTVKAGNEIYDRLKNEISVYEAKKVTIGTTHSILLRILKQELPLVDDNYDGFYPMKIWQREKLIKESFTSLFDKSSVGINISILDKAISSAKNKLLTPEALHNFLAKKKQKDKLWIAKGYKIYENLKREKAIIDFDDMIYMTYHLLRSNPDVLSRWQDEWDYINVDEFQDSNSSQFLALKLLADKHKRICFVGDIQQSLYGFSNAEPSISLNLHKHYPTIVDVRLKTTYRCMSNIVEYANKFSKIMKQPATISVKEGGNVQYLGHFDNDTEEAKEVVSNIKDLILKEHNEPKSIYVLYRMNKMSASFETALAKNDIPFVVEGGKSFFDRREIVDIISYLRIAKNPIDTIGAYKIVFNRPNRFISKGTVKDWENTRDFYENSLEALNSRYEPNDVNDKMLNFYYQLKTIETMKYKNVAELIEIILRVTKYREWYTILLSAREKEEQTAVEGNMSAIEQLSYIAKDFKSIKGFLIHIDFLKKKIEDNKRNKNAVKLMTVHKSKGLEARTVFLTGMSNGILPHERGTLAEERCIAYVGITRAKENLFLSGLASYGKEILTESDFLVELGFMED